MYTGGHLGHAIYIMNESKIYGFRQIYERPAEGSILIDLCHNLHNDTVPIYLVTDIEFSSDPNDMFHANIRLISRVPNTYKKGDENWYLFSAKEFNEKVTKEWNSLGFFAKLFRKKPLMYPEELFLPRIDPPPYKGFLI